jgi:predicted  nucleic acid-binding Zn-ribbon protein
VGKVYQSVRGVVQGTLHRRKSDIMVSVRPKGNDGSLNDAIQELEKIFVDGIGRLKAAVIDDQAAVASEAQHAEQVIESLKVNITVLDAKLKETEDTLQRKDIAGQKMEASLSNEIRDLQSVVKKKEEALESRDSEVNDLKSKVNVLTEQVTRLELAIQQAKAEAASEVQHAEQVIAGLKVNITVLEANLKETEDTVHKKDIANQKLEESLSGEIRDLQSVVKKKEEALESRDSEVNDLKSNKDVLAEQVTRLELAIQQAKGETAGEAQHAEQVIAGLKAKIATLEAQLTQTEQNVGGTDGTSKGLDQDRDRQVIDLNAELKPQTNGTKEMSAESLADIQAQDIGTLIAPEQLKTSEEKPATSHFQASGVTSIVIPAIRETVSQDTFDRMIAEFSELTNVIGSIAALIVRDHVRTLGESMKEFPQTRLTELVESLSGQISDDKLKVDFRKRFGNV